MDFQDRSPWASDSERTRSKCLLPSLDSRAFPRTQYFIRALKFTRINHGKGGVVLLRPPFPDGAQPANKVWPASTRSKQQKRDSRPEPSISADPNTRKTPLPDPHGHTNFQPVSTLPWARNYFLTAKSQELHWSVLVPGPKFIANPFRTQPRSHRLIHTNRARQQPGGGIPFPESLKLSAASTNKAASSLFGPCESRI